MNNNKNCNVKEDSTGANIHFGFPGVGFPNVISIIDFQFIQN